MNNVTHEELRAKIVRLGVVKAADRLISRTGGSQDWLIDLRPIFLDQPSLERITVAFWNAFEIRTAFQVGGMETAAIPLLTSIYMMVPKDRTSVNAFIIRKERKTTGRGNIIEGALTQDPIVLVDDILNSGASAEKARVSIEASGGKIDEIFVVIDFRSRKGLAWRKAHDIRVTSLFTIDDFDLELKNDTPALPQKYSILWRSTVSGANPFYVVPKSAPVLVGDRVYRGCDAARMHAFDTATGQIVWEFVAKGATTRKGIWSTPAVHAGRLYFGAYDGTVYCLDAKTGREIWSQAYGEWVGASPLVLPRHGLLYIGIEYERPWSKGTMSALDMSNGHKVWEHGVQRYQHGSASHYEKEDLVIWGSADHEMKAFKAATGDLIWTFPTKRSVKYAPAIDEERGLVAFASFDKNIYLLEAINGNLLGMWETGGICYTTPLFARKNLFCGSGDRKLYIIDLETRCIIKTIDVGARVYSSPILVGHRVIFGTSGGRIYEVDADTLDVVGIVQMPDSVTNAVVCSEKGEIMFASTYMNDLFAIARVGQ